MRILRVVCLASALLSCAAAAKFVHAFRAFGYTDNGTAFVVDTAAGLVFQVSKTDGSIISLVFNGTEYRSSTNGRFSQIASGLGTPTTVTAESDGATYVKITIQTGPTNGVVGSLTHYLIVRNGENTIYMATFPTAEPAVGELRWITRLNHDLIPNGPVPSELNGTTGAIESTDIFGNADGTTRSKYYGDNLTHGKDRAMDLSFNGATGPGIGCWMVFGTRESSSGGPFFRDIENQAGGDQEIYNYMNSGHNQTEPYRLNVLHGPYALVFTTGDPPTLPVDFSWIGSLNLMGWVPPSGRGTVSGTVTGIPSGFQAVVGVANSTAQYWAAAASDGSYAIPGIKAGTYTATLYKGELEVATSPVTVTAGETSPLNVTSTETGPSIIFRIGEWDGTPAGLLNGDKIVQMHPSDVRMSPWNTTNFTVGLDDTATFPAIQFRGQNSPTTITFDLAPNQITDLTLRIGITCAYNGGRPSVQINGQPTVDPPLSNQPNSRSFTIGTYRGNNTLFTYTLAAGALVAGENRLTIMPISGSTDLGTWLSAGWVYDAVELDGPIGTPVINYVGGNPLVINGTSEPGRNIALTLDGSISAGSTVAGVSGSWMIAYNASLTAGSHSFTAVASDNLGHSSPPSAPYTFNTNITTPAIVAAVGDSGTFVSGATTSDRTFVFNGTAGAGDTVKLTRAGTGVIATLVASGSGDWTFDYSGVALGAGTNRFYATSSNAGGTSPSSPIFVLNIQGTPRITIVRLNPLTETITSGMTSVVFRVAFSGIVSGVSNGAFILTTSGSAAAAIASVSASSGTIFDVTVNNLAGTGMLRLDLKPGNGIVDSQGNPEPGYHAGEVYTLVLPTIGNGTWIRPVSGGLWSDPANWLNAVIPDGNIYSADFSTLDLTAGNTVHLDSPRTINSAIFGDSNTTTPASWILDNNGLGANTLSLAGTTPTMTVNTLGTGAAATMLASLAGTGGLTKAGAGSLVLGAANMLTGTLNLNAGILLLPQGGSLNIGNNPVNLALNTQLNVNGGSFTNGGLVTAVTSQVVIDSGSATLGSFRTNSDFSGTLRVNGGTLNVGDVNIRRNGAAAADFTSGFIVAGTGVANATTIGLGTANSTGAMSIEGNGSLTATGTITIANQTTGGRGGAMRVLNNGRFASTDATLGVLMCRTNGANANNVASATFTGGVSTIERFTLGFDSTVTAGSATITVNGGTIYIGGAGIVKNGAAGLVTNLNFSGGVVGAKADWSTSLPINLPTGGNIAFKSSDASDAAHNIALTGVLAGAGGFTKTGGGELALDAANTFNGAVAVNGGTLSVNGSLAAGTMAVNSGGTLAGVGTINRSVTLNSGGTVRPGGSTSGSMLNAASLAWGGGGVISYDLGASSNQLALSGALTKGAAGPYKFVFTSSAGFADGNIYTLLTFGSTDFTAVDFTFSGLPDGFSGIFTVTANSITFTPLIPPSIVTQPQNETVIIGGIARFSVVASGSPVLGYQWFKNNVVIPSATSSVLTIDNVQGANIGSYSVKVTNAVGSVTSNSARLLIAAISLVNHAPSLNSAQVDGSLQQMLGESFSLNGITSVSGDLLVPGTPDVVVNGSPSYTGTLDGAGSGAPSNYSVTLNSKVSLDHVIRRTDPVSLPLVSAPVQPTGSRSVTLNNASQSVGDWVTVRNLTLNGNVGVIAVPGGAYGDFTANGGSGFTLGVPGATEPAVYYFQHLMLNNQAAVDVVGPVIVIVATGFSVSGGSVGNSTNLAWLTLNLYTGGLTLNNGATVYGYVSMPNGILTIGGNCQAVGVVAADSLIINKDGKLLMDQLN